MSHLTGLWCHPNWTEPLVPSPAACSTDIAAGTGDGEGSQALDAIH